MKRLKVVLLGVLFGSMTWMLVSCGGGSDGGVPTTTTSTGYLKDSNVGGLTYVSGGQTGITGTDGSFTYTIGQTVTFSIGGVTVGTAPGKKIVTPVDFVSDGSSSSIEVINIVRFLMLLDEDQDPENGISISAAVILLAENWAGIDFSVSETDFAGELGTILTDIGTTTLTDAITAQGHLEETMRCSYSGAYAGTYSGDSYGHFGILIDTNNGNLIGVAYSPEDEIEGEYPYEQIDGNQEMSYGQSVSVSGDVSDGSTFHGNFPSVDHISGNWENSYWGETGTFSGTRIGGAVNAKYRFTGRFTGDDYGLFTFDIDSSHNLTGIAYSVKEDQVSSLIDASISGNALYARTSEGTIITGTIDLENGTLSGSWNWQSTEFGLFSGSGCRLN